MTQFFIQFSEFLLFLLVGAVLATPFLYLNHKVAPRLGLIDWPKARGLSDEQIPIIGHSLVILSIVYFVCTMQFFQISPWFVVTSIIIAIMGYWDDRKPLSAIDKMFLQIVCVVTVVLFDPKIHLAMTERYGSFGTFVAIFFILGLMNAVNFVDGIDGLAGTVIAIGSLGFVLLTNNKTEYLPYLLFATLLIGMTVPFLYMNVVKRKGFLGNVGSYYFSYVLGMMHLSLPINAEDPINRIAISSLCFIIPVADAFTVLIARLLTRRSPFVADKGHLHHRLVQTGLLLRYVLITLGCVELVAVVTAFCLYKAGNMGNWYLPTVILASFTIIIATMILLLEKATKRRVQSYFQMLDNGETVFFFKYHVRDEKDGVLPMHIMMRLEARINAEIRVTDVCYVEEPDTLFVTLKTIPQRLNSIAHRLEQVFLNEKVKTRVSIEQGEFIKVAHLKSVPKLKQVYP